MPFIVAGTLRTASGLGAAARLCHRALVLSGVSTFGIDLTAALMQRLDDPEYDFAEGDKVRGAGTLVVLINSPLFPLGMCRLGRRLVRNKYVIGYWAWELPMVPHDWRFGVPFVHEIWVPSKFVADAVRPVAAGRPVRVMPYPLADAPRTARVLRSDRPFTTLVIFNMASSFARKNPIAAIAAFRRAFGEDPATRLILKTSNSSCFPDGIKQIKMAIGATRNIFLIDRGMSLSEIEALYAESDVVMSLHRSEGFGLTLAEAMMRGLPVIATNWSANVDYLSSEVGFPVPYRLVPADDPQGTYHHPSMTWADADIEAAAEALRILRREPELALALGRSGAAYAAQTWGRHRFVDKLRQHLDDLPR